MSTSREAAMLVCVMAAAAEGGGGGNGGVRGLGAGKGVFVSRDWRCWRWSSIGVVGGVCSCWFRCC